MKHPIARRLMYLGFQGLRAATGILPLPVVRAVGRLLGIGAYAVLRRQRRLTVEHLGAAWGETLPPARRRRIARGVFANLGQNAVEWLRLRRLTLRDIERLVTAQGLEHLRGALAKGNGAIVLTGHFGNWELIPLYLKSLGFEGGVLARRLRYPEYESFLITMRGEKGIPTFARGSLKEVARLLRANQLVGMLPDQDMDSLEGVFVNFFGRPAYTPAGPAALSLMTGSPIIPCFLIREGGRFRLVIEPPVSAAQGADRTHALIQLTQAWSDVVEAHIRRHPDHWVWMHRRWKTQPNSAVSHQQLARSTAEYVQAQGTKLVAGLLLTAYCLLLSAALSGCAKQAPPTAETSTEPTTEQMSEFLLTGYEQDGSKRWELKGTGAAVEGQVVTIHHPDGVGYDRARTGYMTASAAQVHQPTRHVRLEHDVTIHTSEGLWLTTPVLHWRPDQNQLDTEDPVRIETDHMLLRGRRMSGYTQLQHATVYEDIELVLNPGDGEAAGGGSKQVVITCDGPLQFDYEHHVATFEHNVHVRDPNGDLYSDKLIAYLDGATHTIRYAEAIGRVRIHQHQNSATSERAVYEPAVGKITLVGQPSLLVYPDHEGPQQPVALGGLGGPTVENP